MNLTPRDRRAVLLGSIALAAILVVRFAVVPWWDSWRQARDRTEACRAQLTRLGVDLSKLASYQDTAVKLYGPSVLEPLKPSEAARIAFTKTVQDVLRAGGINFESITPQPSRDVPDLPDDVELLPLQVKGKCEVAQLAKCLAGMPKATMPVIVDRIQVTNSPTKPGQLEVTMVLATLAQRERNER
jgi:hypothetical protein